MAQQPLVDKGLRNIGTSRSYSDTPHLVGLLWMSDQPAAETSTSYKRKTSMPPAGFEPAIAASQWKQTCALDRAPIRIDLAVLHTNKYI
jgi:hypothetical protein